MQAGRLTRAVLVLLTVLTTACSTQSPSEPGSGSSPLLAVPSVLRSGSDELESASYLLGSEYERSWAHNRAFTREHSNYLNLAGTASGCCAFAGYLLSVPVGEFDHTVHVDLEGGVPVGEVWLGVGDSGCNCWWWRLLDETGAVQLDPSRHLATGTACVYIIYTGSLSLKVNSIWLGAVRPPLILEILPRIGTGGATQRFSVCTVPDGEALSCVWNFGAAAVPSVSCQLEPVVQLQEPSLYDCSVTASNGAGSYMEEFSVRVVEGSEYLPQTLYAIPLALSARVGEAVTVRVVTGALPTDAPLRTVCSIGLTVDGGGEYVSGSFNVGAPGNDAYDVDGVWSNLSIPPQGFIEVDESYIGPVATDVAGEVLLIFYVVPVNGGTTTQAGDLFNFQLRFSAPGTYQLGFRAYYEYERTYYADDELRSRRWYDISNNHLEHAHRIVVTE